MIKILKIFKIWIFNQTYMELVEKELNKILIIMYK